MKTNVRASLRLVVVSLVLMSANASAQIAPDGVVSEQDSMWVYRKAGTLDVAIIGTSLATAITSRLIGPSPGRWQGGILADEDTRDFLRLKTRHAQHTIEGLSDVSLSLATALPMFDATIVAIGYYRDPVAARQIAIINGEVVFVLAALQTLANSIASRERPYGRRCGGDLADNLDDCVSRDRNYSFFSGHSAQSFGAAALTCTHHARLKLYGGGFADTAQCLVGFGLATFTATARVMADKHYLSDVITGAFFGTLTGFALPYFLRYRTPKSETGLNLRLLPAPNGLGIGGSF